MTSGQENLLALIVIAAAAAGAWGWFSDKSRSIKEDEFNRDLRKKLEADKVALDHLAAKQQKEYQARLAFLESLQSNFEIGYVAGRKWLARYIAEADKAADEAIASALRSKKRPAHKAA